ncbi:hypothetical protein AVEN_101444-1 [Araneus ventricosus]|uniref:Uncharacterized protein n=1 Tax=Araneus ventricosus TaxID=182803 RepID=A0A4Y2CW49_ARAVE|nr:hypothetical protein AVEN_101444-1 [Araneus ventricosus]
MDILSPYSLFSIPSGGGSMTIGSFSSNVSQKPPWAKQFVIVSADIRFQAPGTLKSPQMCPYKWGDKFHEHQSFTLVENEGLDNYLIQN